VIKYWGKRDDALILPVNSSLSATLNQADLKTQTTVLLVRGHAVSRATAFGSTAKRKTSQIRAFRRVWPPCVRAAATRNAAWPPSCTLCRTNNFPTAAGLASSAAGYACLAFTLAQAFGVPSRFRANSRCWRGSARARRAASLYGGFVRWSRGERADGLDSLASQVVPASHWPAMRILILVVSDHRKEYSSTSGQETSVQTSELLKYRASTVVPERMRSWSRRSIERDFAAFGKLTMQDSNQFHAVCLDTYPPIFYLNETSRAIIRLVHNYNAAVGELRAAYTFDAGPNAVVFVEEQHVAHFGAVVRRAFPPSEAAARHAKFPPADASLTDEFFDKLEFPPRPDGLKYVISTSVGEGPPAGRAGSKPVAAGVRRLSRSDSTVKIFLKRRAGHANSSVAQQRAQRATATWLARPNATLVGTICAAPSLECTTYATDVVRRLAVVPRNGVGVLVRLTARTIGAQRATVSPARTPMSPIKHSIVHARLVLADQQRDGRQLPHAPRASAPT
jgi:diphosphomevalonate decarboxylase